MTVWVEPAQHSVLVPLVGQALAEAEAGEAGISPTGASSGSSPPNGQVASRPGPPPTPAFANGCPSTTTGGSTSSGSDSSDLLSHLVTWPTQSCGECPEVRLSSPGLGPGVHIRPRGPCRLMKGVPWVAAQWEGCESQLCLCTMANPRNKSGCDSLGLGFSVWGLWFQGLGFGGR